MQPTSRVALYSSGTDLAALECQEAALRNYLAGCHPEWRIVAVYRDIASDSSPTAVKTGLQQAIQGAAAGQFDNLAVCSLDRLASHMGRLSRILHQLATAPVALTVMRAPFDTSTPVGRLICAVLASMAGFEDNARQDNPELKHLHDLMSALARVEDAQTEGTPQIELVQLAMVDVRDALDEAETSPSGAAATLAHTLAWIAEHHDAHPGVAGTLTGLISNTIAALRDTSTVEGR